ncbi:hypothetical protein ACNTMW_25260 [Planosporangium sp. 12N6]|uniref:hypothetical protein n=1 Tax=Planosporangium spinosum TaxID=3402278 RepID=UPI003CEA4B3B
MTSMRARHYAPLTPLETEPVGPYTAPGQREEALWDALRGVELGRHDERTMIWAVRSLDNSTLRVIVSWLERVRLAGPTDGPDVIRVRRARRSAR